MALTSPVILSCSDKKEDISGATQLKKKKIKKEEMSCEHCGKNSCDTNGSSHTTQVNAVSLKTALPSCNLNEEQLWQRKDFLQSGMAKKIEEVKELETGYELLFSPSKETAAEILEFISFEKQCCSSFTYALVFKANNESMGLQIYGSKEMKKEIGNGFKQLGLIK